MKKYFSIACLGITLYSMPGCKKAENITVTAAKPEKRTSSFFGADNASNRPKIIHLYKDTVYNVDGTFTRQDGEQLIIDEGTVLKVGSSAGITIQPGGVILANGTAQNPIVFTSDAPTGTQNTNWAGITIQGRSTDNTIGIGAIPTDFSGTLHYVRIEFAGLTLTALGSGTTIDNVQVSYTQLKPAFEIDGGTFNARNLLSYACGGPADFYITRGYTGKMQNILAYRHPFFGTKNFSVPLALTGMLIENNPYDTTKKPYTSPVLSNLTVLGPNGQDGSAVGYSDTVTIRAAALITTGNAHFRIRNSVLAGFPEGGWYLDDSLIAASIVHHQSEFTTSIVQSNDSNRAFYLLPGAYNPFGSQDFKTYMVEQASNQLFQTTGQFTFSDPFNYHAPNPAPKENSPVLTGALFTGVDYSDPYFVNVTYRGALGIGANNWLTGWTNFTPLQTNYNFPQ